MIQLLQGYTVLKNTTKEKAQNHPDGPTMKQSPCPYLPPGLMVVVLYIDPILRRVIFLLLHQLSHPSWILLVGT